MENVNNETMENMNYEIDNMFDETIEKNYAICFSYNRDYITGDAPHGIIGLTYSTNYNKLVDELKFRLIERDINNSFEFGWNLEYRLCILEYLEDNTIKEIKLVDMHDEFWHTQLQKYNKINTLEGRIY